MVGKVSHAEKQLKEYHHIICPPGKLEIKIPVRSVMLPLNNNYQVIEGRKFYIVLWGLNLPGKKLWCQKCGLGEFVKDQFYFIANDFATPVIDISRVTSYAISMIYKCNYCKLRCKANSGKLFHQILLNERKGYPVDPRYPVDNEIHLTRTVTKLMEKNLLT